MCWNGGRSRRARRASTSTGICCRTGASGGVLLPILGAPYGKVLEDGEIVLKYDRDEGTFSAWYYEHRLPISPSRYGEILRTVVAAAGAENERAGPAVACTCVAQYPRPNRAQLCRSPRATRPRLPTSAVAPPLSIVASKPTSRHRRIARPRCCCIACLNGNTIGWRIGGSRSPRLTTGASSTSMILRGFASRIRERSGNRIRLSRG